MDEAELLRKLREMDKGDLIKIILLMSELNKSDILNMLVKMFEKDKDAHLYRDGECPYTLSHTRHWCGYRMCRDS